MCLTDVMVLLPCVWCVPPVSPQTRVDLYTTIEYQRYEDALDAMFAKDPVVPKAKL